MLPLDGDNRKIKAFRALMAAGTGMSTSQRGKAMTQTPMAGRTRTRMERGEEEEEEGSKW